MLPVEEAQTGSTSAAVASFPDMWMSVSVGTLIPLVLGTRARVDCASLSNVCVL